MGKRRRHTPETSGIDQLPDDVLLHILSLLNPTLAEIARTSILSRRLRYLWRYTTCLDFDATTALPRDRLEKSHDWYIAWVNKVIDVRAASRGMSSVKKLRIWYELDASKGCHIDKWVNFAVVNPVETLHLDFSPYRSNLERGCQYKLSKEPWLRAPSGLSNIKCLKSLFLSSMNVSRQFIDFVLSSCPLLEDVTLYLAASCSELDVSSLSLLQLRRLKITSFENFALTKLCAPCLTSLYYESRKFEPQKIDVPMLIDLAIGDISYTSQPLIKYIQPFFPYFSQLEKLELIIGEAEAFELKQVPKLVKLKYLKICVNDFDGDMNPYSYRVLTLINGCPMLETFAMEIFYIEGIPSPLSTRRRQKKWRKLERKCAFKCLKELELYAAYGKTMDQEVTRFIVRNAPNLKKLFVDIRIQSRCSLFSLHQPELLEIMKTKAEELCLESHSHIDVTVVG